MSVYRQIYINYWQDAFILELKPEEKYFYIYLLTNSKTKQCGLYELPSRIINGIINQWNSNNIKIINDLKKIETNIKTKGENKHYEDESIYQKPTNSRSI